MSLDLERVRSAFPILARPVNGRRLAYLDSAATTQKPRAVLERLARYYEEENAAVHRSAHALSERATAAYEAARARVARFLGVSDPGEVVFVRGATEAVNLVAATFGRERLGAGDELLLTEMEHHSNLVPWQRLCQERGARLAVLPVDEAGELELTALDRLLGPRTRLLALTHVSNVLGTVNPVREVVARAHARGVPVLVDGAQAAGHLPVDVRQLGCDFYALSGHKVYGPTGIGVLWGKRSHLESMPPWQSGGDMIRSVSFEQTTFAPAPQRFEAGTPDVAGAVGLAAALDFLTGLGWEAVLAHERALCARAAAQLSAVPGVRLLGAPRERAGVISFLLDGVHPHDLAAILDREGVAIRAGHHCAQPLLARYGLGATARLSLAVHSGQDDVDALVEGVRRAQELLG